MLIWPANSWVFWLAVAVGVVLFLRFGIFPRCGGDDSEKPLQDPPRTRLYILGAIAGGLVVVCAVLPSVVFAGLIGAGVAIDAIDAALWTIGASLALVALALAAWALFSDRPRGRKRCPKCWYDMAGSPTLTCPECGKTAASDRKLHKTRRRWRLVGLAAVVLLIAAATGIMPKVRDNSWPKLLPDVVFIATAPFDIGGNSFKTESQARFNEQDFGRLNREGWWPRRALADWSRMVCLREEANPDIIFRGIVLAWDPSHNTPEIRSLIAAHAELPSPRAAHTAAQWFAFNARSEPEAAAIFDRVFATGDVIGSKLIAPAFIDFTGGQPCSLKVSERLLELGSRPEPLARVTAVRYLGYFIEDADVLLWRERVLADESPEVRAAALSNLVHWSHTDPLIIKAELDALMYGNDKLLDSAVWALALSDCQNERLWRAFPGAIERLGKSNPTSQVFWYLSRGRSSVRVDALLRICEEAEPWPEVVQALRLSDEFSVAQVERMQAVADRWRSTGEDQPAALMEDAIIHAQSVLNEAHAAMMIQSELQGHAETHPE